MHIQRRIYVCLTLLAAVVLGGSAGFRLIEGWGWFDAFCMTLTTTTAIG